MDFQMEFSASLLFTYLETEAHHNQESKSNAETCAIK